MHVDKATDLQSVPPDTVCTGEDLLIVELFPNRPAVPVPQVQSVPSVLIAATELPRLPIFTSFQFVPPDAI